MPAPSPACGVPAPSPECGEPAPSPECGVPAPSPECGKRDHLSEPVRKRLSGPPQPGAEVPVGQQVAVQQAAIVRHLQAVQQGGSEIRGSTAGGHRAHGGGEKGGEGPHNTPVE